MKAEWILRWSFGSPPNADRVVPPAKHTHTHTHTPRPAVLSCVFISTLHTAGPSANCTSPLQPLSQITQHAYVSFSSDSAVESNSPASLLLFHAHTHTLTQTCRHTLFKRFDTNIQIKVCISCILCLPFLLYILPSTPSGPSWNKQRLSRKTLACILRNPSPHAA